ncbi:sensor histidine kinase KdpD [Paenibacillus sp. MMS20-IR301]|uniref:sensor histidine kinase KdpD n=1 Tax=Paenibacillus sp. MMS20-IR301 TaxID=2895946 RepID=UPI0028E8CA65|nr:sensor histidine kinase KdpD [Paenibacillus sp. MMS20-IR301]WNS45349.1 sensor histidine kinase KdpD [Paenibacillus sp. MMS20-IR301]
MAGHTPADKKRGRLKIFFGYAAGSGKTSAMLNAAHEEQRDGVQVLAGYIEPHGRPETAALLQGLELVPPREISHNGHLYTEFDLDAAIRRRPELILLDELAHTNAPGCRHKKRVQDIEELLRAGINVYATVNVEHIESLTDVITSITGMTVHDRIPDSVFDSADQVELVDIAPGDLIERLNKGKLYPDIEQRQKYESLFIPAKLIALREIALRYTADQLNRIALQIGEREDSAGFYTKEHILVCLSSAVSSKKVIRTAARMAEAQYGSFTALYVETSRTKELTAKNKAELRENLRLAEQLGAQVATVYGEDVPGQIAEYAKTSRVSKIVLGRSHNKNRWPAKSNFVDKLTAAAPNMDIYIIPDNGPSLHKQIPQYSKKPLFSLADSSKTLGILIACTVVGLWFQYLGFSEANIITVYILGVLLDAMVTQGRMYSAVTSILSVLIFNYFFTAPLFSLQAYDSGYPVTFLVMLSASFITSTLTLRVKEQARESAQKAYRTEVLLETSRKLQQAKDTPAILNETALQMVKLLDRSIIIYEVQEGELAEPLLFPKEDAPADPQSYTSSEERKVAEWVLQNNKRAGVSTDTFSAAHCLYHAVRGGEQVFAVAGIVMEQEEPLEVFEKSLMIAMLGECALALEKDKLNEKQKEISMQIQQEQLRTNLLRGISHDLRTPLTSISGNAGILIGNSKVLSETQKQELYNDIYDDSMWLINLVENLLSITRIDNGALHLNFQAELLEEVIAEAMLHVNRNKNEHVIELQLEDELLMARMDSRLIIQVLINLVDNAIKYTEAGSHITLSVKREGPMVRVEVADDGPGISPEAKVQIFEMFYTADNLRGDGRRGLGLGLALCKSIIHAHGGTIDVQDQTPRGSVFSFTLQAEEVNVHE